MMRQLFRKFKSTVGTSLAETLISMIFIGFLGVAVTSGIAAIQRSYGTIVRKANEQVLLSTTVTEIKDLVRYSIDYDTLQNRFQSKDGVWFDFQNTDAGIYVSYYPTIDSAFPAQSLPLVPDANGRISKIKSSFDTISYADGQCTVTGLKAGRAGHEKQTKFNTFIITPIAEY